MSSRPQSKRSQRLKERYSKIPDISEARKKLPERFRRSSGHANDRVAAITAAAIVEDALRQSIASYMNFSPDSDEIQRLFSFDDGGLLSAFGSRITLAYTLGDFGRITRNDLQAIKRVRNIFAHTAERVRFNDDDIRDICFELKTLKVLKIGLPSSPRMRYVKTCSEIATRLLAEISADPALASLYEPLP